MSREQAAAELRARIAAVDPALGELIGDLKDTFGARLKFIRLSDGYSAGDEKHFNERGIIAHPYERPRLSNKGSAKAWLNEQEQAHIEAHAPQQARAAARRRAAR